MNYIQHTRAAHQQLARQPGATPHHVSLYWTLFFEWNAARFPAALDLDHPATMRAARIGSRQTYRAALYDLDTWDLLSYQPSRSRHERSRCFLTDLSGPEVAPVNAPTTDEDRLGAGSLSGPEVAPVNLVTKTSCGPDNTTLPGPEVVQALRPEVAPVNGLSGPEVVQASLYGKTRGLNSVVVNKGGGGPQKKIEVLEGEGLSGVELLDNTAPPNGAGPAQASAPPKAPQIKRGAPKKMRIEHSKGIRADTVRAAAAGNEPRRPPRGRQPETTFQESAIYDKPAFTAAFAGTDYALADLTHYHELINLWRDKKTGEPPRRADWVATAKRFMFNDATDNRLKLAPGVHRHDGPGAGGPEPGGPAAGYRSSRWD